MVQGARTLRHVPWIGRTGAPGADRGFHPWHPYHGEARSIDRSGFHG